MCLYLFAILAYFFTS